MLVVVKFHFLLNLMPKATVSFTFSVVLIKPTLKINHY